MAIRLTEEVKNALGLLTGELSDTSPWNGAQGNQVEYYIKEQLDKLDKTVITKADYDGTDLTFKNANDEIIGEPIEISLVKVTYDAFVDVVELKVVDEKGRITYHESGSEILFSESNTYYLGVALCYTAQASNTTNKNGNYRPTIKLGTVSKVASSPIRNIDYKYFNAEHKLSGINSGEGVVLLSSDEKRQLITNANAWVDITSLLRNNSTTSNFTVTYSDSLLEEALENKEFALTNRIISIQYNGSIVNTTGKADFVINGIDSSYSLYYSVDGSAITAESVKSINNGVASVDLHPGLNKLKVYACKGRNSTISSSVASFAIQSDPLFVDVINTNRLEGDNWNGTAIALGTLPSIVGNNNVVSLFKITAYSETNTPQTITIYLDDNEDSPTNIIKQEVISADRYDTITHIYETTVSKYVEVNSNNASKNLFVYIDGLPYGFYAKGNYKSEANIYKTIRLEEVVPEYVYVTGYSKSFDQITGSINNLFITDDFAPIVELPTNVKVTNTATDGWVEENGRTIFRVTPSTNSIFTTNPIVVGDSIQNGYTLEFAFKTNNVVDYKSPIFKIGSWELWPNKFIYNDGVLSMKETLSAYVTRLTPFVSGEDTHIMITIHPGYQITSKDPDYPTYINSVKGAADAYDKSSFNLMRIYVNGTIARSIELTDSDLRGLFGATLDMNNLAADLDLYLFRVYFDKALNFEEVERNYLSYIPYKTPSDNTSLNKLDYYKKNDILENGKVSYEKCQGKYNTILYVYPIGSVPPNYAKQEDVDNVTIIVNYANNANNLEYGGRLNHLSNKGQGTSAKKYLVWNQQTKVTDDTTFVSNQYLNADGTKYNTANGYKDVKEYLASHQVFLTGIDLGEEIKEEDAEEEDVSYKFKEITVENPELYDIYLLRETVFIYNDNGWTAIGAISPEQLKAITLDKPNMYLNVSWRWDESTLRVEGLPVDWTVTLDITKVALNSIVYIGLSLNQVSTDVVTYTYYGDPNILKPITFTTKIEESKSFPNYYIMPDEKDILVKKLVGKVNFASSMLTHKQGICKMYDACYKFTHPGVLKANTRKAVHEEAFLYFWTTAKNPESVNPEDIKNPTFLGFQTWGSGKCDKATIGLTKATKEYLVIEGGANPDKVVNFKRPWISLQRGNDVEYNTNVDFSNSYPKITTAESEKYPWKYLCIISESISYLGGDSWGIDVGCKLKSKQEELYTVEDALKDEGYNSLKHFRNFYDFVYKYNSKFEYAGNVTKPQSNWDPEKLYIVTSASGKFANESGTSFNNHQPQDIYRAHETSSIEKEYTWVPAGTGWDGSSFSRLNLKELVEDYGYNSESGYANNLAYINKIFRENLGNYVDISDVAFHQAFIRFISGTDNRAKNTYWLIIGPDYEKRVDSEGNAVKDAKGNPIYDKPSDTKDVSIDNVPDFYKIRLFQDDVDTAFITDNAGAFTKTYDIIEPAYTDEFKSDWGDGGRNVFFNMFDVLFENEIKTELKGILEWTGIDANGGAASNSNFYTNYYSIINLLPPIGFNITSKLWYEVAHIFLSKQVISGYENNGTNPLTQSHGSAYEAEKQFMSQRIPFLASYALVNSSSVLGSEGNLTVSNGDAIKINMPITVTPILTLYPVIDLPNGGAILHNLGYIESKLLASTETDMMYYRAEANQSKEMTLTGSSINGKWPFSYLYQKIKASNFYITDFTNYPFTSATDLEITDSTITKFKPIAPALQNLTFSKVAYLNSSALDLKNYTKIRSLNIADVTGLPEVIFPNTSMLTDIKLPPTLNTFRIYNNPNLSNVSFEPNNLQTLYVDGSKCGNLDVSKYISYPTLTSVQVVNGDIRISKATLLYLIEIGFVFSGNITIFDDVDVETLYQILKFWNITSQTLSGNNIILQGTLLSNDLYGVTITYTLKTITQLSTIDLSFWGTEYPINEKIVPTLNGNNARITNGEIKYTFTTPTVLKGVGSDSGIWSFSDGILNVKLKPASETILLVTATIPTLQGSIQLNYRLILTYIAPAPGDYIFTDGSYGKIQGSKTIAGFVYKVDTSKKVMYVMNNSMNAIKGLPLGPITFTGQLTTDSTVYNGTALNTLRFSNWLRTYGIGEGFETGTNTVSFLSMGLSDSAPNDSIYSKQDVSYSGPDDVLKYVKKANEVLTHLVKQGAISAANLKVNVTDSNTTYSIELAGEDGLANLYKVIEQLENMSKTNDTVEDTFKSYKSSIIFPYFYARYLYKTGNRPEFSRWYAPSAGEWSDIIYYRVLSGENSQNVSDPGVITSASIYHNPGNVNAIIPNYSPYVSMFNGESINPNNPVTSAAYSNYTPAPYSYLKDYINNTSVSTWGYGYPILYISANNSNWYCNGRGNYWYLSGWEKNMVVNPHVGFLFAKISYSEQGLKNVSYE